METLLARSRWTSEHNECYYTRCTQWKTTAVAALLLSVTEERGERGSREEKMKGEKNGFREINTSSSGFLMAVDWGISESPHTTVAGSFFSSNFLGSNKR